MPYSSRPLTAVDRTSSVNDVHQDFVEYCDSLANATGAVTLTGADVMPLAVAPIH